MFTVRFIDLLCLASYKIFIQPTRGTFFNGGRIGGTFEDGMTKTACILLDFKKSDYQYLLILCCSKGTEVL